MATTPRHADSEPQHGQTTKATSTVPRKRSDFVKVTLRVCLSMRGYPGPASDYFVAVVGPDLQLGSEDPHKAPRCTQANKYVWVKDVWLLKDSETYYKFLVVRRCDNSIVQIEDIMPHLLFIGMEPVAVNKVFNKSGNLVNDDNNGLQYVAAKQHPMDRSNNSAVVAAKHTEQWSPLNPVGKKHYTRELLLKLQNAVQKPVYLPNIPDIILEKSQSLPRQPNNQINKSWPAPRIININIRKDVELHKAKESWKPGYATKDAVQVDTSEELFKQTKGILNKITPQKFDTLVGQMQALPIDTENKLRGVIDIIFEKAISEPSFCGTYASMCKRMSLFKVPSEIKPGDTIHFLTEVYRKCQRQFLKNISTQFESQRQDVKEAEDGAKKEELKHELQYEESKAKRRLLGTIRFIGEMFNLKMLTESIMHGCVSKLLHPKDPENLEGLCQLLTIIGKELDVDKETPKMDEYFQQMGKIVGEKKTSPRIRFMLQNCMDLRTNKWIPRHADSKPMTIDQIHEEAQEKAFLLQQNKQQHWSFKGSAHRDGPPSQMSGSDCCNMKLSKPYQPLFHEGPIPEKTTVSERPTQPLVPEESIPEKTTVSETPTPPLVPEESIPEKTTVAETPSKPLVPEESIPEKTTVAETPSQPLVPEESIPEKTTVAETPSQPSVPEESIPEKTTVAETPSQPLVPEESIPEKTTVAETPSQPLVPDESIPEKTTVAETPSQPLVPEESIPEKTTVAETPTQPLVPEESIPEKTTVSETPTPPLVPEESIPEKTTVAETPSKPLVPEESIPEKTTVAETPSKPLVPEESIPEKTTVAETPSQPLVPEESIPEKTTVAETPSQPLVPEESIPEKTTVAETPSQPLVPEESIPEKTTVAETPTQPLVPEESIPEKSTVAQTRTQPLVPEESIPEKTTVAETPTQPLVHEESIPEKTTVAETPTQPLVHEESIPEKTTVTETPSQPLVSEESIPEKTTVAETPTQPLVHEESIPEKTTVTETPSQPLVPEESIPEITTDTEIQLSAAADEIVPRVEIKVEDVPAQTQELEEGEIVDDDVGAIQMEKEQAVSCLWKMAGVVIGAGILEFGINMSCVGVAALVAVGIHKYM